MPRSRSSSLLSSARSTISTREEGFAVCRKRQSTSVVLPWSTWAMMATLRISMGRRGPGAVRIMSELPRESIAG